MTDETVSLDSMLDEARSPAPAVETQAPQPTPETPAPATPDAPQGQPRDETGRFAPKAETQPAPVAQPAQPTPQAEKPLTVDDVKGIIDERQKRQAAEARATQFEDEVKKLRERVEQQAAKPIPDYNSDPEGFAIHLREESQKVALNTRFETSELVARQSFGDEAVQAAMDWGMAQANASQAFATEYVQQRHPVDWIVKRHQRDQLLSDLGDDPKQWEAKLAARLAAKPAQPQPTPQAQQPVPQPTTSAPLPTPSLAAAVSAGGANAVPEGAASLDALLKD